MASQAEIDAKLKALELTNPHQSIKKFIALRPVNLKNKVLIQRDLDAFQLIFSKIPQNDFDQLIKNLSQDQCMFILDYMHRFMQYIGEKQQNTTSGNMLKFYDKILRLKGNSILIATLLRSDTLVSRISNF